MVSAHRRPRQPVQSRLPSIEDVISLIDAGYQRSAADREAEHLGALLTVAVYITPFLLIGLAAKIWIKRKGVDLSDVQAEGDPNRKRRPRFLLGIWRDEGRE
jgi:hypothetical protein